MTKISNPPSVFRVLIGLALGGFVGRLVATAICFCWPKTYESRATLEDSSNTSIDYPVSLSPAHAAIVVDALKIHHRWDLSFEEAIRTVSDCVTFIPTPGRPHEASIVARCSSPDDARQIVDTLTHSFSGLENELKWAAVPLPIRRFDKDDTKAMADIRTLRKLMIAEPDPSSETYQRRLQALAALTQPDGRFTPPGTSFVPPFTVQMRPNYIDRPISPDIPLVFEYGLWTGISVAGIALLIIQFRRPELLVSPPRQRPTTPDWAREKPIAPPRDAADW